MDRSCQQIRVVWWQLLIFPLTTPPQKCYPKADIDNVNEQKEYLVGLGYRESGC
jgi:hypothetical protein